MDRCGVWLIGALGSLSTTVIAGARALARGVTSSCGLLTEREELAALNLVPLDALVFGGWEIRDGDLVQSAREIHDSNGSLRYEVLQALEPDLREISTWIRPGLSIGCGPTIERMNQRKSEERPRGRELVDRLIADLQEFRSSHQLTRVVVVNLASTEPPVEFEESLSSLEALEGALDNGQSGHLRAGAMYAYAAFRAGAAYLNFTPSNSALCPANEQLAAECCVPYMGNDGKTGETLVKSALAPMFKYRNLIVDSWIGYNILGNRDGEVLADEDNKASKVQTKDSVLPSILGYPLHTHVGIDYVPAFEDRKVAWDHIHFRGFLDYKMSMQFIWEGCDSILAAPVVIDLVRFLDDALARGVGGPLTYLASFFKGPIHCTEHDLHRQFQMLTDFLNSRMDDE